MAGPTFGAVGSAVTGTGTTVSIPVPSGVVAGSLIIAVIYTNSTTTINGFGTTGLAHAPNSPVNSRNGGGGTFNMNVLYKIATGADTGTYDVTQSASDFHEGAAARYDGANTSSPWDVTTSAGSTSTGTVSPAVSLTTTQANELLFHAATQFNGGPWTPSTGFTQRFGTGSPNQVAFFSDDPQAVAGPTGTVQATVSAGNAEMAAWLGGIAAAGGAAAPDIGRVTPTFHPGFGPGKSMFQTSPRSTDAFVTINGTATLTGAGTLSALVTQGAIQTSTGAGTVTDNATLGATETSTGAGTVTNAATLKAPVTATGAGVVTNSPTQGSSGNLIGGGTLNPLVTLGAIETVTGSGVLTDAAVEQVTVSLTGAGTLTNAATIRATVSMVGAGTLTASSGQSCNMVGAGTLNATPTILAPVTMTGAGVLTAAMLETATAALTGAGTVAAPNVLKAPVAATGAGILTANGTAPGSSSGEIWGVAT